MKKKNTIPETKDDILVEIEKNKTDLHSFRFGAAGGKSSKPHEKKLARKQIARLKTALRLQDISK